MRATKNLVIAHRGWLGALFGAVLSVASNAAPVVIADAPPLDINTVKPNIMFTLDTSGSMQEVSVPDVFGGNVGSNCFKNHIANPLYYNPSATYAPPKSYNGGTNTTTAFPDSVYTAAPWDGFNTTATYRDNPAGGALVNQTGALNLSTRFRADFEYASGHGPGQGASDGFYMQYTAAAPAVATPGFCHPNASYTKVSLNTATAAQQINFANWFSYYRSRMQAMKSAAGIAFADLDDGFRVGFHNIWQTAGSFLNVLDFTGSHRQTWYQRFYTSVPSGGTPTRAATIRVGEYFRTGVMPGAAGSIDPVQQSCQANYHIVSTDGYWNEGNPAFAPGSTDDIVPALPSPVAGLTAGAPWPALYRENTAAAVAPAIKSPTMSDIATYYWATDLRTAGGVSANNVPISTKDPANWQHVVLFGVSIAASGTLPYTTATKATIENEIAAGLRVWPNPINNSPSAIDDLWHSTVNARGNFFNVNSPGELASALSEALLDISSRSSSASGAALANSNLAAGNAVTYIPSYRSGEWSGELVAKKLDPLTGLTTTTEWKHGDILNADLAGTGWSTNRKALTRVGFATVPLRLATSLNAAQKMSLGATPAEQQAVLNYLRGDKTEESAISTYKFRPRTAMLGDIINSEPVAIADTSHGYSDGYNPGYNLFRLGNTLRKPTVYFGSNDGFFHAVNGEITGPNAGKELFVYMPSELMRAGASGIAALTYKTTNPPATRFAHKYYVDGRIGVRDVDFLRTSQSGSAPTPDPGGGGSNWRTVLITGMGKGGRSYTAFDVTTAPSATDTEAALATSNRVLWEFTDADMGFTYGAPAMAKTVRYGWVAMLTGGYNNTTGPNAGKGVVYIVDVKTGTLLHKFITPDGSATDPLGLAHLSSFIPDATDFTTDFIYAGDLNGNVWRFDVSTTATYDASGIKLAQLKSAAGQAQPITSAPRPYADPLTGRRFIAVGTGKLLSVADVTDQSQQTFYNIADGDVYTPKITGLPVTRANLTNIPPAQFDRSPSSPVSLDGWLQDLLPASGERIIKESAVFFGIVIPTSITPSTDPCSRGGVGTAYARAGLTSNNKLTGVTKLGGGLSDPPFHGPRPVITSSGAPVVQVLKGDGTIDILQGIQVPGGFVGSVVNYREIIE